MKLNSVKSNILLRDKCPYSGFFWSAFQMRENTDQKNSEYGQFSGSVLSWSLYKTLDTVF